MHSGTALARAGACSRRKVKRGSSDRRRPPAPEGRSDLRDPSDHGEKNNRFSNAGGRQAYDGNGANRRLGEKIADRAVRVVDDSARSDCFPRLPRPVRRRPAAFLAHENRGRAGRIRFAGRGRTSGTAMGMERTANRHGQKIAAEEEENARFVEEGLHQSPGFPPYDWGQSPSASARRLAQIHAKPVLPSRQSVRRWVVRATRLTGHSSDPIGWRRPAARSARQRQPAPARRQGAQWQCRRGRRRQGPTARR